MHGSWAAEQGVRPLRFKFLPAALAGQRNRDAHGAFPGFQLLIALPAADAFFLQKLLPLDFFLGQLWRGKLKLPDKAKVNFYLLHPVAVDALWGVDDDFLNKFVDHGRGQLGEIRVLPCQLQKLLHTGTVLCESGQPFFRFCDRGLQRFLLGFVIRQQTVKAFIGDAPDSKGFIELLDDGIQLKNPLFLLVQLPLGSLAASAWRSWEAERTFSRKASRSEMAKVLAARMVSRISSRSALVLI